MDEVTGTEVPFEQHLTGPALEQAQGGRVHAEHGRLVGEADQVAGVGEPLLAVEIDDEAGHGGCHVAVGLPAKRAITSTKRPTCCSTGVSITGIPSKHDKCKT